MRARKTTNLQTTNYNVLWKGHWTINRHVNMHHGLKWPKLANRSLDLGWPIDNRRSKYYFEASDMPKKCPETLKSPEYDKIVGRLLIFCITSPMLTWHITYLGIAKWKKCFIQVFKQGRRFTKMIGRTHLWGSRSQDWLWWCQDTSKIKTPRIWATIFGEEWPKFNYKKMSDLNAPDSPWKALVRLAGP